MCPVEIKGNSLHRHGDQRVNKSNQSLSLLIVLTIHFRSKPLRVSSSLLYVQNLFCLDSITIWAQIGGIFIQWVWVTLLLFQNGSFLHSSTILANSPLHVFKHPRPPMPHFAMLFMKWHKNVTLQTSWLQLKLQH